MFGYYFIFYIVALLISLVYFKKFVDTPLRYFPLLIAYTLFNELLGYFIQHYEQYTFFEEAEYNFHNIIIYNIYQVIFFGYLFWLYYQLEKHRFYKRGILICGTATFLAYFISLFFQDPFHISLFYADTIGSLATVIIILLHFCRLEKVTRFNLMVWVNWGLLVFYLYLPFDVLNAYLNVDFYLEYHLRQVLWAVVAIMYSFFIIGFLVSKRVAFR